VHTSLDDLISAGKLDATLGTSLPQSIRTNSNVGRLFPDFVEREKEYYGRTGVFPIMHTIAIRRELYEQYPFIASSLYSAFTQAKNLGLQKMENLRALRYMTPWLMRDIDEIHDVFGGDPWPYGIEPNRRTIETLIGYMVQQSMIAAPVTVDELFLPVYA
jgi:4,5-dihydroxyphthalate decarboxylase